jgi:hypothetical protein
MSGRRAGKRVKHFGLDLTVCIVGRPEANETPPISDGKSASLYERVRFTFPKT